MVNEAASPLQMKRRFHDRHELERRAGGVVDFEFSLARLALNDQDDTSPLAGAIVYIETQTTFTTIEFATRLAEGWKLEVEGRFLPDVANGTFESTFERDHTLKVRVLRYF